jgi:hypothetical protein
MNHFRFRLVLATAGLTAALTVLALKLGGFLHPATSVDTLHLMATNQVEAIGISPYQISCGHQLAMLTRGEQVGSALHLLDPQGRLVSCKPIAHRAPLLLSSTGKYQ